MANFNYNRVILGGRLTADPELKTTSGGTAWTNFSVAVNRKFTSKDGQDSNNATDFITCVAFSQRAEFITKYFKKGSSIAIEGNLQTRKWTDKDNQTRYATEVIVDQAMFVDSKGENRGSFDNNQPSFSSQPDEPKFDDVTNDDDLPF